MSTTELTLPIVDVSGFKESHGPVSMSAPAVKLELIGIFIGRRSASQGSR